MMAPQTSTDYIEVHVFRHFHHRDNTRVLWNELDMVLPEYRERKEWHRNNGAGFDA